MQGIISPENPVSLNFEGVNYPYVIRLEETADGIFFVHLQSEKFGDRFTNYASYLRFWSYGVSGNVSYRQNEACFGKIDPKTHVPKFVPQFNWPCAWTVCENPNWGIRGKFGAGGRSGWTKRPERPVITGIVPRERVAHGGVFPYATTVQDVTTEYEPFRGFWKRYGPEMRTWLEEDGTNSYPKVR